MKITADMIRSMFIDDVEFRKTSVRNFVMNQNNSYEDRLDIYLHAPDHLRYQDGWVFHHPTMKDDDWFDYNGWERHSIVDLVEMPEYHEWNEEKIKEWYTGCMDKGSWSFCYDW